MVNKLSDRQIEYRLNLLEKRLAGERNTDTFRQLSHLFQSLIDEQVRRDVVGLCDTKRQSILAV